ncbi:HNH endonuclease [Lapidilactobacillus bayanensis]|uniref:HNH endonuclease n=1 Tax=Lapidilactobacillus bayanensis TaxID=2485998 RepID=UPI000F78FE1C|nr:HNH endonuclease [Lapidilactobacillus bayanensis]
MNSPNVQLLMHIKDPVKKRLTACEMLLKRYPHNQKIKYTDLVDCVAVLMSVETSPYQKIASRMILNHYLGSKLTNNLIEDFAIVISRNDPLVRRWKEKVLKRDNYQCAECGCKEHLVAHHISYWSDDPVNRINVNNGKTLCSKCHTEAHSGDWFSALVANSR